ncbi:Multidrug resistance regulator 1 [Candida viswanathii]|uniref:Multidrug resistance regulator 1 n=1 Tax=Candida viswanathii TaxID=5486 RepID=A0A367XVP7_9ASCO|nr:Multidrug resistance regulator 1 [Candida viswanathii]
MAVVPDPLSNLHHHHHHHQDNLNASEEDDLQQQPQQQNKTVRKRQRLTLVCLPCRRKKIKCDKGKPCSNCSKTKPDDCVYDDRKFEPRKRKRGSSSQHLHQQQQQQQQQQKQEPLPEQPQQQQKTSPPDPKHDVCVLIQKSELEDLQAKLKYYENLSGANHNPAPPTSITPVQTNPEHENNIGETVLDVSSHLEQGILQLLGQTSDYVYNLEEKSSDYHTNKIIKVGTLFRINSLSMLLYCHLFNTNERTNGKLAFFYLRKLLSMAMLEMLPYVFSLITRSQELFGEAADLSINPSIILFLVRLTDVCLRALMRSNFLRMGMSNDPDHRKMITDPTFKKIYDSTSRFIIAMEKTIRVCLTACSMLSSRYYFAWISIKLRNYFLKLVTSPKFYKFNLKHDLLFPKPSVEQITDLADLIDRALDKVESFTNEYCALVNISGLFKQNTTKRAAAKSKKDQQPQHRAPSSTSDDGVGSNKVSPSMTSSDEVHTPRSTDSSGPGMVYSTQFEDLRFDNEAEIDSIWLQMLNSKNSNQNDGFNGAAATNFPNSAGANTANPGDNQFPDPGFGIGAGLGNGMAGNVPAPLNSLFGYPVHTSLVDPSASTSTNTQNYGLGYGNASDHTMYFDLMDEFPLHTLFN